MSYQRMISWRYLVGGPRHRVLLALAGISLVGTAVGGALVATASGHSTPGVVALVLGMLGTVVFGLLSVFSVFTSVSVLGVFLGVAALTCALAMTTGFQEQFRKKVLGVNAHVIIMSSEPSFRDYRSVMDTAMAIDPDVLAVQPFIFAESLATRGKGQLSGVAIKGIDPERFRDVLDLESHIVAGSVDALGLVPKAGELPPIIIGKGLAQKLKANVGDDITVVMPFSNIELKTWKVTGQPRTHKFRVAGIFYSGFDEYDRRLMYAALKETQELQGSGDVVLGVELKVRDVDRAPEIAAKLRGVLGEPPYQIQDWYELNRNLFIALQWQKLALTIILTLIIMVASFNMVSALTMMVTDKTQEIAILKSMGATSGGVGRMFVYVGIAISGVGTVLGVGIALVFCYVVAAYGVPLDPKVYLIDRLPLVVRPFEVFIVVGVTMLIGIVASVVPALRAASLRPSDGLRYD